MHKVRKNSLSPCYSTTNKENLPIQNLTSPVGISFKNLQQARKKKIIQTQQTQQQYAHPKMSLNQYFLKQTNEQQSLICESTKHKKQNKVGQSTRRQTDKSIDDYRSSLKSKDKQMSSLHSQVNTLNSTILLLKEQLSSLKIQNSAMINQNTQFKKIIKQKNQQIEKIRKQRSDASPTPRQTPPVYTHSTKKPNSQVVLTCQQCQKHKNQKIINQNQSEYEEVIQKLNELEQIQNKLFLENENLKKKENMHQAMFRNFKVLLDSGRIQEIKDLVNLLNQ